jgi:tRNA modification GTPase
MNSSTNPGFLFSGTSDDGAVRVLTAPGRGAVAVVEVRSPFGGHWIDRHFRSRSSLKAATADVNRILYGHWGNEDLVVVRTATEVWEIHCHGGQAAVTGILISLEEARGQTGDAAQDVTQQVTVLPADGPTVDEPETAARNVSDEQRTPMLDAEIRNILIRTRTRTTASLVLQQADGTLHRTINAIVSESSDTRRRERVNELLKWESIGLHLTSPWRVLVLGPPNAGKSSLVNALVGFDRSIVFDQPGTTRDLIEVETVLRDWTFLFLDSAGIHEATADEIELEGIQRALAAFRDADACLLVEDVAPLSPSSVTHDPNQREVEVILSLISRSSDNFRKPVARILNKCDLLSEEETKRLSSRTDDILTGPGFASGPNGPPSSSSDEVRELPTFLVSAKKGLGMKQLTEWLVQTLIPEIPKAGTAIPLPGRILNALHQLRDATDPQSTRSALDALQDLL